MARMNTNGWKMQVRGTRLRKLEKERMILRFWMLGALLCGCTSAGFKVVKQTLSDSSYTRACLSDLLCLKASNTRHLSLKFWNLKRMVSGSVAELACGWLSQFQLSKKRFIQCISSIISWTAWWTSQTGSMHVTKRRDNWGFYWK